VPESPHYRGFTITLRHTTVGRTPLDEWSAQRRDLYLTTRNTHNRQTFMPPAGFEPTVPASERPHTHAWIDAVAYINWSFSFRSPIAVHTARRHTVWLPFCVRMNATVNTASHLVRTMLHVSANVIAHHQD